MAYTTIDKPSDYFNTIAYTGDGGQDVTGVGFQPDLVWVKARGNTYNHQLHDSVRGATAGMLSSNLTDAESTLYEFDSFDSDGFTTDSGNITGVNGSGHTQVAWNWLAGTPVSGTTNNSKSYSGSVNTTSGISIINFVGDGTAGHEIPHHLGVAPKMVIVKNRTSASTFWQTYHYNLDSGAGTHEIFLNSTNGTNASSGAWNNTAPSSTVVTKGTGSYGNENNSNHIMYSFAEKKGYSKFGSYVANGNSDNAFVYTGFKVAFLMTKLSSHSGGGWEIVDNKRDGYNGENNRLYPNDNAVEGTGNDYDLLSNGFKVRQSGGSQQSGRTNIYMAFAENPFVSSGGIPCTAR